MTREEARKAAEVMLAYANGEEIECLGEISNKYNIIENPSFNWFDSAKNYRIKPKSTYRPFKTQEECLQEMNNHPNFGWIVSKKGLEFCCICDIFTSTSNSLMITLGVDQNNPYEADTYFDNYTFADGTPFGIKED